MKLKNTLLATVLSSLAFVPLFGDTGISVVATEQAPAALGPYSQATRADNLLFISGQIAIDPASGHLVEGKIEEQTRQVLKNIEAILASQGLTFENVLKTEVYLKDLNDFKAMNEIYGKFFSFDTKAARATVQVSKLPHDALVEISCIAHINENA